MAFDGITVAAIVHDIKNNLLNGRIFKISQPEKDELLLTIKNNKQQYKLLISASASLPLIYITNINKPSPLTAPSFCMLLRKHISNGKIIDISQPGMERVINIKIEHFNEMGDLCHKTLIVELMGKHSNIIFCDESNKIIDSIKHINSQLSSVREVLPGRDYFIPKANEKLNPITMSLTEFLNNVFQKAIPVTKALYTSITGISPIVSENILNLASIDSTKPATALSQDERQHLYHIFNHFIEKVRTNQYSPVIYYQNNEPIEFSALELSIFSNCEVKYYQDISTVLEKYFSQKEIITRIKQRSYDLRQIVNNMLSKNIKKYDLQLKQMNDTKKREQYRIYGELLTTYGYQAKPGDKSISCINYYDNQEITIPLDSTLTPMGNAKKYFNKYSKLKRTFEALSEITVETEKEIAHLESISTALDLSTNENDLKELKEELIQFGYIKRKNTDKKAKYVSRPLHYIYDNQFDIYIGKNNFQNEELTFKTASANDWWFHAKGIPGSHVIVKSQNELIPDCLFEIAGKLAAYYSKGRLSERVEVDYTQKRNVKKVNGGAPGFVIYHTNYSMNVTPATPNDLGLE